jgi:hypothetical protein
MEIFQSTNNQTHEVKQGTFKKLCDLDKRTWTLEPLYDGPEFQPEPLCCVHIKMPDAPFEVVTFPIWSHKELVGRYV